LSRSDNSEYTEGQTSFYTSAVYFSNEESPNLTLDSCISILVSAESCRAKSLQRSNPHVQSPRPRSPQRRPKPSHPSLHQLFLDRRPHSSKKRHRTSKRLRSGCVPSQFGRLLHRIRLRGAQTTKAIPQGVAWILLEIPRMTLWYLSRR
jgi:hypothetical protein